MKLVLLALATVALGLGLACRPQEPSVAVQPTAETSYGREPDNPDAALEEQLRQGAVQMTAAGDSIQSALDEAKRVASKLSGDAKEAAQDVVDFLDSAGASVADASADAPDEDAVKKDFAAADDERKRRIGIGNDAYRDLEQALGTVNDLRELLEGLGTLHDLVTLAVDDLGDAIEAFGGIVETEQESTKGG